MLCLACVPFLLNLGSGFLWQDEAQTALIAKTVLTHGIPLGTDGRNSFSQDLGKDYGEGYVWRFHPWFQFYLLAGFFAVFGESTLVARLPFALCGAATVFALYLLARSLWDSRRAGVFAALTLAGSVPFLLLSRQCRYYAPTALFMVLGLYAYTGLLQRTKYAPLAFLLSAILLFHAQYIHYAALLAAVCVHSLVYHRDRSRLVFLLSFASFALSGPWIVWFATNPLLTGQHAASRGFIGMALSFLAQVVKHILPPVLLTAIVLTAALAWLRRGRVSALSRPHYSGLLLLGLAFVFDLVILSFVTGMPFFRCIVVVVPISCALAALAMELVSRLTHPSLGIALMLATVWSVGPVPDFAYELTHHYEGPVEGIVRYLNTHASPNDLVVMTYEDLPIKFYTRLRVRGGFAGDDFSPTSADWVIIRQNLFCDKDWALTQYLLGNVPFKQYDTIRLDCGDTTFQNREECENHHFRTVTDGKPVVIYHKRG